jgi:hypothetical protein
MKHIIHNLHIFKKGTAVAEHDNWVSSTCLFGSIILFFSRRRAASSRREASLTYGDCSPRLDRR